MSGFYTETHPSDAPVLLSVEEATRLTLTGFTLWTSVDEK